SNAPGCRKLLKGGHCKRNHTQLRFAPIYLQLIRPGAIARISPASHLGSQHLRDANTLQTLALFVTLKSFCSTPEPGWRNWQTQRTQNPPRFTPRGGSTPPPGTTNLHGHELGHRCPHLPQPFPAQSLQAACGTRNSAPDGDPQNRRTDSVTRAQRERSSV